MLARQHPDMYINACSPGFTNTGMCANYTGSRVPKDVALGADVFAKVAALLFCLLPINDAAAAPCPPHCEG
jgi:hypothetical protein